MLGFSCRTGCSWRAGSGKRRRNWTMPSGLAVRTCCLQNSNVRKLRLMKDTRAPSLAMGHQGMLEEGDSRPHGAGPVHRQATRLWEPIRHPAPPLSF